MEMHKFIKLLYAVYYDYSEQKAKKESQKKVGYLGLKLH